MQKVYEAMQHSGIIPVVAINEANDAVGLAKALIDGGVDVIEITLRTDAALDAIRNLRESGLNIVIGAGTVTNPVLAKAAIDAGVDFIVTPGFDRSTVLLAVENGVPIVPGICTPTELMEAACCGSEVVKFFPSECAGGVQMLKALKGPFADMKFIPTGGINQNNISDYLELSNVLACGGSWICPNDMIQAHRFNEITALTKQALEKIRQIRPE